MIDIKMKGGNMDAKTLKWINAVLQNDETSNYAELEMYFIKNGLTIAEATKAVAQREKCLADLHYEIVI